MDLQVKELVDRWILLTYDLPVTKEGNDARYKFLNAAHRIGAIKHTNSVYLMPWTPEAELAALEVASMGDAFLWISTVKDTAELTRDYDKKSEKIFDEVYNRIDNIEQHMLQNHTKRAISMIDRTKPMIESLIKIAVHRGSMELYEKAAELNEKYKYIQHKLNDSPYLKFGLH